MPYLITLVLGFALGWITATKKGGNMLDKIQYGTIFGMIGMLLTLIALVIYGNTL
ncbi:MAG: hypothetical protein COB08_015985 [Rhodobacteraceae bacterium]|nr:hypothetical protein [Paracoccaceae bacterium]